MELTRESLCFISSVLSCPILFAINLFIGIKITENATPARKDIPTCW